jgi:hypothetical protein
LAERTSLNPAENSTPISQFSGPQSSHYSYWGVPILYKLCGALKFRKHINCVISQVYKLMKTKFCVCDFAFRLWEFLWVALVVFWYWNHNGVNHLNLKFGSLGLRLRKSMMCSGPIN